MLIKGPCQNIAVNSRPYFADPCDGLSSQETLSYPLELTTLAHWFGSLMITHSCHLLKYPNLNTRILATSAGWSKLLPRFETYLCLICRCCKAAWSCAKTVEIRLSRMIARVQERAHMILIIDWNIAATCCFSSYSPMMFIQWGFLEIPQGNSYYLNLWGILTSPPPSDQKIYMGNSLTRYSIVILNKSYLRLDQPWTHLVPSITKEFNNFIFNFRKHLDLTMLGFTIITRFLVDDKNSNKNFNTDLHFYVWCFKKSEALLTKKWKSFNFFKNFITNWCHWLYLN